jgi:hypothetical protein
MFFIRPPLPALGSRREERVMPIGERAFRRGRMAVHLEIVAEPDELLLARADPDVAVERDDVPVAEREAVKAGAAHRAGAIAEVVEVGNAVRPRIVFVVPGARVHSILEPSPARVIAVVVIGGVAEEVRVVARREDERIRHLVEQFAVASAWAPPSFAQSAISPAPARKTVCEGPGVEKRRHDEQPQPLSGRHQEVRIDIQLHPRKR